jgi:hypothetical protein
MSEPRKAERSQSSESSAASNPSKPSELEAPSAVRSLGALWVYSLLRFGMFFILWGLLWLVRVPGFLAAVISLALSIPLSFVLLRKQRDRMARNLELRVEARRSKQHELDEKLAGEQPDD